ncbi:MAG: hypothetical protein M1831_006725 [Alyxoria varia]|nr:MAG: hypothetical protein M1831_006725 [Alyxoria varia]
MNLLLLNRLKVLYSLVLISPGTYSLNIKESDNSIILEDPPIISSPFFSTKFEYNGSEWQFIEPIRTLSGHELRTNLLQINFDEKTVKEKRDQKSTLLKRIPPAHDEEADDQQPREPRDHSSQEPQSQQSEGPQSHLSSEPPAQAQTQSQGEGNEDPPAWANFQTLRIPSHEFAWQYLQARQSTQRDGREVPTHYAYYRAIVETNLAIPPPRLFKWIWPRNMYYDPNVARVISLLVGWEHIHEIFSVDLLFYLIEYSVETFLDKRDFKEAWQHPYIAQLREEFILLGAQFWRRSEQDDLPEDRDEEPDDDLSEDRDEEPGDDASSEGSEGEAQRKFDRRAEALRKELKWQTVVTLDEAISVLELMKELRGQFNRIVEDLDWFGIESIEHVGMGVLILSGKDAGDGQDVVISALEQAIRDESTEWKRESEPPGIVLRRDMDRLRQLHRAQQLRFYEPAPPEPYQSTDDDDDREPQEPLPKRRRFGEGSSKDRDTL